MYRRTPLVWVNDEAIIDEVLAAHVWERLGIPPGLFRAWVETAHPRGSISRAVLVTRAYDNVHGTDHSGHSNTFVPDLPDFAWESYVSPLH